jgi:outer membrane biosynthesis protein TonB
MALIVIAADKGAPGVTTTALAMAAVWPRPVLLAECDPSGGDLVYRFPAADGTPLDPRRGLVTLAVAARRGLQPGQLWEHTQKMAGGLDVLTGVINAEQGAGLGTLWGPLGGLFAAMSGGDVIADCGRLGADGPQYDLVAQAAAVLLVARADAGDVIRLRDRAAAVAAAASARGRRGFTSAVAIIADQRTLKATAAEVGHTLSQGGVPAGVVGGIAHDPKGAELLGGAWGGRLDKTLLIRTARETAQQLAASLPAGRDDEGPQRAPGNPGAHQPAPHQQAPHRPHPSAPQQYPPAQPQYPAAGYPPAQPTPQPPQQPPPAQQPPPVQQPQPPRPPRQSPPGPPYPPSQQQHGTHGRHSSSAQTAGAGQVGQTGQAGQAGQEAGDARWTTA